MANRNPILPTTFDNYIITSPNRSTPQSNKCNNNNEMNGIVRNSSSIDFTTTDATESNNDQRVADSKIIYNNNDKTNENIHIDMACFDDNINRNVFNNDCFDQNIPLSGVSFAAAAADQNNCSNNRKHSVSRNDDDDDDDDIVLFDDETLNEVLLEPQTIVNNNKTNLAAAPEDGYKPSIVSTNRQENALYYQNDPSNMNNTTKSYTYTDHCSNNNNFYSTRPQEQHMNEISYNNDMAAQCNFENNNNCDNIRWNQEYCMQLFMRTDPFGNQDNIGRRIDCVSNSNCTDSTDVVDTNSSSPPCVQQPQDTNYQIYPEIQVNQEGLNSENNNDRKRPARKPPPPVIEAAAAVVPVAAAAAVPAAATVPAAAMQNITGTGDDNNNEVLQPPPPPVRAISAYNFFFHDERDRILNNIQELDLSKERADMILQHHWNRDRTRKRIHRKTHGKIPFTELSKIISKRWKELDDNIRQFYEQIASLDWERYEREKEEWNVIDKRIKKAKRVAAQKLKRKVKAAERRRAQREAKQQKKKEMKCNK